jgi:hypothetical protein
VDSTRRPKRLARLAFDRLDRRDVPAAISISPLAPTGLHSVINSPTGPIGFFAAPGLSISPLAPTGLHSVINTPTGPAGFFGSAGTATGTNSNMSISPIGTGGFHSVINTPGVRMGFNASTRFFRFNPTPARATTPLALGASGGFTGFTPIIKRGPIVNSPNFGFLNP